MADNFNNQQNKQNRQPGDFNPNNLPPAGKAIRTIFFWILLIGGISFAFMMWNQKENPKNEFQVSYNEYLSFLNQDLISKAKIIKSQLNDYEFRGEFKQPQTLIIDGKAQENVKKFVTKLGYLDSEIEKYWISKGITFTYEESSSQSWDFVITILSWALILGVFMFLFKRIQNGAGGGSKGIFSFGKARVKMLNENSTKVTFIDVAGADEAKYELAEIIEFLRDPQKFQRLGGKIPRGVLLLGPPGTGKTLLARAVAGEAGVPFFSISGADFVEMFVGVGASRVRDLFEQAKRNNPCLVFIDEIDAVGRQRGAGLGGGHDEREQTLNQLLVEMDGFEQNSGVIIIAATNRPDVLDPALLRPGRFDRTVVVDRPDVKGREGILKVHTRKIPIGDDVDLEVISKGTPGLSGADLANIVNEAALIAARQGSEKVNMEDFAYAKDKVLMGVERKSMVITDREKETTAYHEIGHALVSKLLDHSDPVHKVSIIPRGRALGLTSYLPTEEFHTMSRDYLETKIRTLLGGRMAEKIVFNQFTTGAGNDLERATTIAKKMVCEWGMSDRIGPVHYAAKQEEVFLGREISQPRDHSEETAQLIDTEIRRILLDAEKEAENLLRENLELLNRLAKVLLEREVLEGEELDMVMRGEELAPRVKLEPVFKTIEPSKEEIEKEGEKFADRILKEFKKKK